MQFRIIIVIVAFVFCADINGANVNDIINKLASKLRQSRVTRLNLRNANVVRASSCLVIDTYGDRRKVGGTVLSSNNNVTFLQCLLRCVRDNMCQDLNWDRRNVCTTFSDTGRTLMDDVNYIYAHKACDSVGSTAVSTGETPIMTLPTTSPANRLPAAGSTGVVTQMTTTPPGAETATSTTEDICQLGYQAIPNQYQLLGEVVSVGTSEECIELCLSDNDCLGVDFNHNAPPNFNCFRHTQIISTDVRYDGCCTRYVKITCMPKQCFEHPVIDLAELEENDDIFLLQNYLTIMSNGVTQATPVECSGACITETVVNSTAVPRKPSTIVRRCDLTLPPPVEKSCDVTVSPSGMTTTTCRCYGDICNAFSTDLLSNCLAYYPLDTNANDATGGRRHGMEVNVFYDAVDAKKNFSARFSGDSSIKVNSLRNTVFSYKTSGGLTPAVTVSVWIKRSGMTGRQAVVNNGPVGGATIDIWTEPDSASVGYYLVKGSVRINDVTYTVQSPTNKLRYNNWHFVVLTVTNKPFLLNAFSYFYVQLFVDEILSPENNTDAQTFSITEVMSNSTDVGLQTSTFPLTIGAQASVGPTSGPIIAGPNFFYFEGSIDEVYIFSRELSMAELQSLKWISSTMGPLI